MPLSEQGFAFPAQEQNMSEDEDERPLVQPEPVVISDEEDERPLVQPVTRIRPAEEGPVGSATYDEDLAPLVPPPPSVEETFPKRVAPVTRRTGPPTWKYPTAPLEQEMSSDSRERTHDSVWDKQRQKVKLSATLSTSCLTSENLRDLHLKHYHMSPAQFNKRTTHLWTSL